MRRVAGQRKRKRRKKRNATGAGVWALLLCAAVLVGVAWLMPKPQAVNETEPAPTVLTPNPYDADDFQYDGQYLTCLAGESVLGVDVSSHQGVIDWQQVKDAGFEFAILRVGYRGYESGEINLDTMAQRNYEGAKAAGLKVGAYFFSQAVNEAEALEEAEFLLDQIALWDVDMPVVFDWEYVNDTARTANMDKRSLTWCTQAFAQRIQLAGYQPMLYFNPHLAQDFLELEQLADYPFWLALYTQEMTYPYQVDMWQYTQDGTVPGINGNVDINLCLPYE